MVAHEIATASRTRSLTRVSPKECGQRVPTLSRKVENRTVSKQHLRCWKVAGGDTHGLAWRLTLSRRSRTQTPTSPPIFPRFLASCPRNTKELLSAQNLNSMEQFYSVVWERWDPAELAAVNQLRANSGTPLPEGFLELWHHKMCTCTTNALWRHSCLSVSYLKGTRRKRSLERPRSAWLKLL